MSNKAPSHMGSQAGDVDSPPSSPTLTLDNETPSYMGSVAEDGDLPGSSPTWEALEDQARSDEGAQLEAGAWAEDGDSPAFSQTTKALKKPAPSRKGAQLEAGAWAGDIESPASSLTMALEDQTPSHKGSKAKNDGSVTSSTNKGLKKQAPTHKGSKANNGGSATSSTTKAPKKQAPSRKGAQANNGNSVTFSPSTALAYLQANGDELPFPLKHYLDEKNYYATDLFGKVLCNLPIKRELKFTTTGEQKSSDPRFFNAAKPITNILAVLLYLTGDEVKKTGKKTATCFGKKFAGCIIPAKLPMPDRSQCKNKAEFGVKLQEEYKRLVCIATCANHQYDGEGSKCPYQAAFKLENDAYWAERERDEAANEAADEAADVVEKILKASSEAAEPAPTKAAPTKAAPTKAASTKAAPTKTAPKTAAPKTVALNIAPTKTAATKPAVKGDLATASKTGERKAGDDESVKGAAKRKADTQSQPGIEPPAKKLKKVTVHHKRKLATSGGATDSHAKAEQSADGEKKDDKDDEDGGSDEAE